MRREEFEVVVLAEDLPDEGRTVAMPSLLPEQITDYIPPE